FSRDWSSDVCSSDLGRCQTGLPMAEALDDGQTPALVMRRVEREAALVVENAKGRVIDVRKKPDAPRRQARVLGHRLGEAGHVPQIGRASCRDRASPS